MTQRLISAAAALLLALQTLACGSTSVTQMTAPDSPRCQATVQSIPTIPAAGGRVEVGVATNRECSWTAASNSSWIQLSPTSGQGEASIALTTPANPQGTTRTGNITLNGSQYAVNQAPSPCTFTVSPTDIDVAASGGNIDVHVRTLTGCSWSTSSSASWLSLSPGNGSGSSDVGIAVSANTGTTARATEVRVAGTAVRVTQTAPSINPTPAPAPAPSPSPGPSPEPGPAQCTYTIDPASREFGRKGGKGSVKVATDAGCAWLAVPDVLWVRIENLPTGIGAGEVKYVVERNDTGTARTGSITIAGQVHLIEQAD